MKKFDGHKLRTAREAAGLSRSKLSSLCHVSASQLKWLELGNQDNPTVNTLAALADSLDTDITAFVS
jgi:transcriptional regulator with XRE-family HTH domain